LQFFDSKQKEKFFTAGDTVYFSALSKGYLNHKGNGWRAIVSLPADVAFMEIADLQNQMLVTMFGVLVLAILLALAFARIISEPIVKLSKAAEALGAGQFDTKFDIESSDEIGILSDSLRKMAANLKNTIEEQKTLNEKLNQSNEGLAAKFRKIEEQKAEIERQSALLEDALEEVKRTSRAMTDSIKYAERIQRSMLPEKELREEAFAESFILFQPRDIVSGDFYWFDAVIIDNKKYFVVAAADCTGHGVPGGFMAMLGANLLNTIVNIEKIIVPELVLNELNKEIKKALHQETHGENSRDGMEIGLCTIDYEARKIMFAGAGRPLVRFRKGEMTVLEVENFTVGGVDVLLKKRNLKFDGFEGSVIDFEHGDRVYLFSDGFKDQFGGENNKKYSQKRFLEKLNQIQHLTMHEQKKELEAEFFAWKGTQKQTDDVLVLGFTL
jgi:serine phosphatase RsbU (regulator of sigma subunit)